MRYLVGLSCEEYPQYGNISFCHSDLLLLSETLVEYCDYSREKNDICTVYLDADESVPDYWYNKLTKVSEIATNEDTVLFYFAGHGMVGDEDAYFLLPNTKIGKENSTALSLKMINSILKKAKCNTFSIIDACHSGVDARGTFLLGFDVEVMDKSWATLASCSKNENSYPDIKREQGTFTYFVAEAIKEWEKNKEITIEGIKIEVSKKMEIWCKKNGIQQHPTLNGSVVGIQDFAKRNDKILPYEVQIVQDNEEENKMTSEITIVKDKAVPVLWSASGGIQLPKTAEVDTVLSYSAQLREKEIKSIFRNYSEEDFEMASEAIWERAILVLKERVLSLGLEFVGEMVGLDDMAYVRELPPFEVINLAAELGFINSTGKMRLSQANEIVQHYRQRDVEEEMPKNESDSVIRACVQYILGYESSELSIEFSDFRNSLKLQLFEKQTDRMMMLIGSPYFYKRTTVRTLINLIASTEGAEYEMVSSNFATIIEAVWDGLTSDDKYFIGTTYSKYVNRGEKKYIYTFKNALEKVHGYDYVPENLRSISFIQAAKNIKRVHYEFNNFYNEPDAVTRLERLGNQIPKPALKESVSACIMVYVGNAYGSSDLAKQPTCEVLNKLDTEAWKYYINECLPYDEDVLLKISAGDRRTDKWCELVNYYKLREIEITEKKLQDMMSASGKFDKNNTRVLAKAIWRENLEG